MEMRKRGVNGQFVSRRPPTSEDVARKETRKDRERQLKDEGNRLLDAYLDAFFLRGNGKDWIMADTSNGPLAKIPSVVMKHSFVLPPRNRCKRARDAFNSFALGHTQEKLKQKGVMDGNDLESNMKKRRIFPGRRLPRLNSTAEMAKVWGWIDLCREANALKGFTREEAYEVIRKELLTYKSHNGSMYYVGYPPQRDSSDEENEDPNVNPRNQASAVQQGTQNQVRPIARSNDSSGEGVSMFSIADVAVLSEEEKGFVKVLTDIFVIAKNDRLFFLLCKIEDDMRDCRIDLVATVLWGMCQNGILKTTSTILKDFIRYASYFGKEDVSGSVCRSPELLELKERIKVTTKLLKYVRRCFPELKSYETMQWPDSSISITSRATLPR